MTATQPPLKPLPSSTFSFNYNPPPPPTTTKARRTSLALPSAPREVPAWRFADDTRLPRPDHDRDEEQPRRGKMRRLDSAEGSPEKKVRRKWTMEETQQLVGGCNKVLCTLATILCFKIY